MKLAIVEKKTFLAGLQCTLTSSCAKTLIDYIIDNNNADFFSPFVSDTLRTIGKKPIDHLATSVITTSNDKTIQSSQKNDI